MSIQLVNHIKNHYISDQSSDSYTFNGLTPEDYYPMPTQEPHGLCVIINVKRFQPSRGDYDEVSGLSG